MSEETKKTDLKWHEFHQRKYPIYVQWGVQSNSKLEELRDEQARAENKGMCCLDGRKNRMTKEEDLIENLAKLLFERSPSDDSDDYDYWEDYPRKALYRANARAVLTLIQTYIEEKQQEAFKAGQEFGCLYGEQFRYPFISEWLKLNKEKSND